MISPPSLDEGQQPTSEGEPINVTQNLTTTNFQLSPIIQPFETPDLQKIPSSPDWGELALTDPISSPIKFDFSSLDGNEISFPDHTGLVDDDVVSVDTEVDGIMDNCRSVELDMGGGAVVDAIAPLKQTQLQHVEHFLTMSTLEMTNQIFESNSSLHDDNFLEMSSPISLSDYDEDASQFEPDIDSSEISEEFEIPRNKRAYSELDDTESLDGENMKSPFSLQASHSLTPSTITSEQSQLTISSDRDYSSVIHLNHRKEPFAYYHGPAINSRILAYKYKWLESTHGNYPKRQQ